jgi:hypothetical protein
MQKLTAALTKFDNDDFLVIAAVLMCLIWNVWPAVVILLLWRILDTLKSILAALREPSTDSRNEQEVPNV